MNEWSIKRRNPYTEIGITRKKCIRCGKPALYQWQICADDNHYRPICEECDIALNRMVLLFMKHPRAKELSDRYKNENPDQDS